MHIKYTYDPDELAALEEAKRVYSEYCEAMPRGRLAHNHVPLMQLDSTIKKMKACLVPIKIELIEDNSE